MPLLAIDLGGTKLALAVFSEEGKILLKEIAAVNKREGKAVGALITDNIKKIFSSQLKINAIGISVPGISHPESGTVWAPNIPGWTDYPLMKEIKNMCEKIPVMIDSDRACYIAGELWQGNAKGCKDAIFLSVGTGIGAGIITGGNILRGAHDIAGAIGWMALQRPFLEEYMNCGCFEHYASGEGIAKLMKKFLREEKEYHGELKNKTIDEITSHDVFTAYESNDVLAIKVMQLCIEFWGMAAANLVSLFNPEKIIFGGGVFGPAIKFIPAIKQEAAKWAQPISMQHVSLESAALGGNAGVYGAAFLALQNYFSLNP